MRSGDIKRGCSVSTAMCLPSSGFVIPRTRITSNQHPWPMEWSWSVIIHIPYTRGQKFTPRSLKLAPGLPVTRAEAGFLKPVLGCFFGGAGNGCLSLGLHCLFFADGLKSLNT